MFLQSLPVKISNKCSILFSLKSPDHTTRSRKVLIAVKNLNYYEQLKLERISFVPPQRKGQSHSRQLFQALLAVGGSYWRRVVDTAPRIRWLHPPCLSLKRGSNKDLRNVENTFTFYKKPSPRIRINISGENYRSQNMYFHNWSVTSRPNWPSTLRIEVRESAMPLYTATQADFPLWYVLHERAEAAAAS